jgi:type I restriction enzyme, S subunit
MSKWKMVRLQDVCSSIVRGPFGSALKKEYFVEKSESTFKVYEQKHAIKKNHNIGEYFIDENKYKELSRFKIKPYDIIISCSGTIGEIYQLPRDCEEGVINQALLKLTLSDVIDSRFFQYYWRASIKSLSSRGSGIQNISSVNYIKEMKLPLANLDVQKHIADTLDKTQEIIDCHKKQLQELDNLIKVTFYDTFGNPVANDKGWNIKSCKDVTTKIGSGSTPTGGNESYKDSGISLIRSLNVHNGYFKYDDLAHIDEEQADKLKNVIVEKNDVLLNITGASVARSCIVPNNILPARVNQHVAIVRPDSNYQNYTFLNCMFTDDSYQQKLWKLATGNGATREALTKQQIETLEIIIPPLDLQTKFAQIVINIEEQKTIVKKSLTESQNLFNSLMNKYFD